MGRDRSTTHGTYSCRAAFVFVLVMCCVGCGHHSLWFYKSPDANSYLGAPLGEFHGGEIRYGFHGAVGFLDMDSVYAALNPGAPPRAKDELYFTFWIRLGEGGSSPHELRLRVDSMQAVFSDDTTAHDLVPIYEWSGWSSERLLFEQLVDFGVCKIPQKPSADSVTITGAAVLYNEATGLAVDTIRLNLVGVLTEYRRSRLKDFLDMNQ